MTKQIVTWKRKKANDNCYQDPNTNDRVNIETDWVATFTETSFCISDWRFISLVEYPDDCTQESIDYFQKLDKAFEFTFVTESEANTLLAELWPWMWIPYVSVSDFIFTDNRPIDDPSMPWN